MMNMGKGACSLIILGLIDIGIAIGGLLCWKLFEKGSIIAMTAITLALTTYFGFVTISQLQGKGWAENLGSMRTAIASAVLVLYLFLLPVSIFTKPSEGLSEFGEEMIKIFSATMGIIIPFYFGASAYVQVNTSRSKSDNE